MFQTQVMQLDQNIVVSMVVAGGGGGGTMVHQVMVVEVERRWI